MVGAEASPGAAQECTWGVNAEVKKLLLLKIASRPLTVAVNLWQLAANQQKFT